MKTAAACVAFILALAVAGPVRAADPYVECVQNQLTAKGYDPGPIDGLMGARTRAAWSALKETLPHTPRLDLLPPLKRNTAIQWCREIAHYDTSLGRFMPSRKGHQVKTENELMRMRFMPMIEQARRFFRSVYGIEIAGRVGVVLGADPKAIARKIYAMSDTLPLRLRGVEKGARARCGPDRIAGAAYPDRAYVCLPWLGPETKVINQVQRQILMTVFVHEFVHLIQYELSGFRSAPWSFRDGQSALGPLWLAEGLAELVEERFFEDKHGYSRLSVLSLHTSSHVSSKRLNQISRKMTRAEEYQTALYAAFLLTERVGSDAIFDYWRKIGAGRNWTTAFRETFGMDASDFERLFEDLRADVVAANRFASGE